MEATALDVALSCQQNPANIQLINPTACSVSTTLPIMNLWTLFVIMAVTLIAGTTGVPQLFALTWQFYACQSDQVVTASPSEIIGACIHGFGGHKQQKPIKNLSFRSAYSLGGGVQGRLRRAGVNWLAAQAAALPAGTKPEVLRCGKILNLIFCFTAKLFYQSVHRRNCLLLYYQFLSARPCSSGTPSTPMIIKFNPIITA